MYVLQLFRGIVKKLVNMGGVWKCYCSASQGEGP